MERISRKSNCRNTSRKLRSLKSVPKKMKSSVVTAIRELGDNTGSSMHDIKKYLDQKNIPQKESIKIAIVRALKSGSIKKETNGRLKLTSRHKKTSCSLTTKASKSNKTTKRNPTKKILKPYQKRSAQKRKSKKTTKKISKSSSKRRVQKSRSSKKTPKKINSEDSEIDDLKESNGLSLVYSSGDESDLESQTYISYVV